ncbi:LysR family transcriptional regulator [Thalassotalea euphylliae]|uniref:LysR family transcriptional regulator n=1 Tax=Thalassotalea euphylliae TaxID=1655234 RepID=A0A3E0UEJ0_9GAMM|nr:LysR family transcriptional regulator [Thalassotalea euphylliae]REL34977.1 LysR family transcriptional regulator [Thalassotalea euphylliae]
MKKVLDDIQVFCAVVEQGSLKKASEQLGVPHSTVSRRLDALESSLGLDLIKRTTREISVTARGHQLYQECSPLLASLTNSINAAVADEIRFNGELSISMPVRAGVDFLGSWLIDFAADHPDLSLSIGLSNVNQNLVREQLDLAFRVGPLEDSSAIALHLWDIPYVVCAHKDLLIEAGLVCPKVMSTEQIQQITITESQLSALPAVVTLPASQWAFQSTDNQTHLFTTNQKLTLDDLGLAYHSVGNGRFVGFIPEVMHTNPEVLEINVEGLTPRTRAMYAYYYGRRHTISQIRHLVGYIKQRYAAQESE